MPLESALPPVEDRVKELNARYRHHAATTVLQHALADPLVGRVAMVSSFGAESVVLLHLVSVIDRTVPVVFIDTRMLFPETLAYQIELSEKLGLAEVRTIRPDPVAVLARDVDAWINGRKRYQGQTRAEIDFFEVEGNGRIKINPLAHWDRHDIEDYMVENRLPRHPLVSRGYPSIGCLPCTTAVKPGEDPRAGRWRGRDKEECGIHFINGRLVRGNGTQESAA